MKALTRLLYIVIVFTVVGLAACTNYGKKVKHGSIEVYYKDPVSKELAQRTADFVDSLVGLNSDSKDRKSMQLEKIQDTLIFRMVIDEKKIDMADTESFSQLGRLLSTYTYNNGPVNVELTNNRFKTIKSVPYSK